MRRASLLVFVICVFSAISAAENQASTAHERVWLRSPIAGKIEEIAPGLNKGSRVTQGQRLFTLFDFALAKQIGDLQTDIACLEAKVPLLPPEPAIAKREAQFQLARTIQYLKRLSVIVNADLARPGYYYVTAPHDGVILSAGFRQALLNRNVKPTDDLIEIAFLQDKKLDFTLRSRVLDKTGAGEVFKETLTKQAWDPKGAAVIVIDMWDSHHCLNAVRRVEEMAPRMNEVIEKCRAMGMTIIHAPSSCMDAYKDHPGRKRAKDAPTAKNLPKDIGVWCHMIPSEEKGKYPIDQKNGGCDSDPVEQAAHREALIKAGRKPGSPWLAQYHVLKMNPAVDIVSDSGVEIWNVLEDRKINNVIILGVHTNMCVLGRPFGLRQMAKNGKNVVLMRDMTDTMYDPKSWPYVNHYKGTALIIEHIEKFVAPTITSDQVIGGKSFKFKADPN